MILLIFYFWTTEDDLLDIGPVAVVSLIDDFYELFDLVCNIYIFKYTYFIEIYINLLAK